MQAKIDEKMTGKLFVIGVGPGDPELLTLKAVRILNKVNCIFVPKGREEGNSLALSIVQGAVPLDGKEIVEAYFPMRKTRSSGGSATCDHLNVESETKVSDTTLSAKWRETVDKLVDRLNKGIDLAFITIGDPAIYSTFFNIYDKIMDRIPSLVVEMVPGVSSINAAAASARMSLGLGNDRIAILPANYLDKLRETLETFDTVVLMKVNTVFDEVVEVLRELSLTGKATVVSQAFMDGEMVFRDIDKLDTKNKDELSYFTIMIVRK